MTGEVEGMGDPFAAMECGEMTLADQVDEVFGVDKNWAGYLQEKDQKMKDRILQNSLLWLVFATVHEHDHQFSPGNHYDSKLFLMVSNFVIQQWQVQPVQIERYPFPGKTIRYLLMFEAKDAPQLLQILPSDCIKLSKGLGCCFHSLAHELSSWQHLMIGGVPVHMTQKELERVVLSEEMLWVTVFTQVRMENGMVMDKVYLAGDFAQEKSAVMENLKKEFSHKGCILCLE
ncbi:hypothetical protein BKA82DRAFT_970337 [Pisolithus tinctorius]|nr:hypothetical protein BKA82DRAFT_970337 [Pisolithus tinctorius]